MAVARAMWYAVVVLFSAGRCRGDESENGLRYLYTVTLQKETVVCFGAAYVDGESILTFSSEKVQNPAKWLKDENVNSEQTYFKQRCQELKREFPKITNDTKTAGAKTLQVSTECTKEKNTTNAYDGKEVKTLAFNDTHAQGCSYRLRIYRSLMSASIRSPNAYVERRLLHHCQCAKLRCSARDFYPAGLDMQWYIEKNGTSVERAVNKIPSAFPQGDGLYRRYIELTVNVGEETMYVCKICGIATGNDVKVLRWEGVVPGLSDNAAFLLALFLPAFAAVVIVAFGFVWHRRDEIRPFRVAARPSTSDSTPYVGRRGVPLANTTV